MVYNPFHGPLGNFPTKQFFELSPGLGEAIEYCVLRGGKPCISTGGPINDYLLFMIDYCIIVNEAGTDDKYVARRS